MLSSAPHFACFDVRTGHLLGGPVAVHVPIYEVRNEEDAMYVKDGMFDP
jgi:nitrite reductase/ring-hydroxylating ferredoxin subunit